MYLYKVVTSRGNELYINSNTDDFVKFSKAAEESLGSNLKSVEYLGETATVNV